MSCFKIYILTGLNVYFVNVILYVRDTGRRVAGLCSVNVRECMSVAPPTEWVCVALWLIPLFRGLMESNTHKHTGLTTSCRLSFSTKMKYADLVNVIAVSVWLTCKCSESSNQSTDCLKKIGVILMNKACITVVFSKKATCSLEAITRTCFVIRSLNAYCGHSKPVRHVVFALTKD